MKAKLLKKIRSKLAYKITNLETVSRRVRLEIVNKKTNSYAVYEIFGEECISYHLLTNMGYNTIAVNYRSTLLSRKNKSIGRELLKQWRQK